MTLDVERLAAWLGAREVIADGGPALGNRVYRYDWNAGPGTLTNPQMIMDLPVTLGPHVGPVLREGRGDTFVDLLVRHVAASAEPPSPPPLATSIGWGRVAQLAHARVS